MQETKETKDAKGAKDEAERAGAWQTQAVSEKPPYLRQRMEVVSLAATLPETGIQGEGG